LYHLVMNEFVKLKRLKLLLLIPAGILIPAAAGIVRWNSVRGSYSTAIDFKYGFPLVEQGMSNGILMIAVVFLAIGIFVNEYRNNEMENLFSYPYSRVRLMFAKLIAIFIITAFMVLVIFLLTILYGFLVLRITIELWLLCYHFTVCLIIILLFFSVVPAFVTVCIISRNYVLPVSVAVLIYLLNPQLFGIAWLRVLPWNVPYYMIQTMQLVLSPNYWLIHVGNYMPYLLSSILTFAVPFVFNLIYYSKTEIY
jgi:bacitracin transport system permease protein